jgi:hypothetical protein
MKYYDIFQSTTHKNFPIKKRICAEEVKVENGVIAFYKHGAIILTCSASAFVEEITEAEYNYVQPEPEPPTPFFHRDNLTFLIFIGMFLVSCAAVILYAVHKDGCI